MNESRPRSVALKRRLAAIAGLVPSCTELADIGSDHGKLPVHLLQTGKIQRAIVSDISPCPLDRARAAANKAGVAERTRFILCDGLSGYERGAANVYVIAGMGGETIAGILLGALARASDFFAGADVILQPMSKPDILRRALLDMGFFTHSEALVRDSGVIYPVIAVRPGRERELSPAELLLGKLELALDNELFEEYIEDKISRTQLAVLGLSNATSGRERRVDMSVIYNDLIKTRERVMKNADCKRD